MRVKQLIENFLGTTMILQIATSSKDIPWVCTVCFAYDTQFNLYWFSRHDARHSREIAQNSRVAGAVAVHYSNGDRPRGLQFDGIAAEMLDEPDLSNGLVAMQKRYNVKNNRRDQLKREIVSKSADYGLYRLQPTLIVLHDKLDFPDSPQQIWRVPKKASEQ